MRNIKKIFQILNFSERKQLILIFILILLMALIEAIGVASILPFVGILANQDLIETNYFLNTSYQISKDYGVENNQQFIFLVGSIVLFLLVVSLALKALATYAQIRFSEMRSYSVSRRLLMKYLSKPYVWFLNKNSSEIGKNILQETAVVIGLGIYELLQLFSKGSVIITILLLLIYVDPQLATQVGITFCIAYSLIYMYLRKKITQAGEERFKNNELRFKLVSEAFSATKQIKLGGLEEIYTDRYSKIAYNFAKASSFQEISRQLPRYFLEALVFGSVMLIMLYLISQTGSFNNSLPILSLYVFAGYRLMPSVQQVYASFSQLRFIAPSIKKIYFDIIDTKEINKNEDQETITFKKSINLKNVYYTYPNSSRIILNNVNLNIPVKKTIGFIGTTGSGKTTIIDIILGLLQIQKGTLEIDGKTITERNVRPWQDLIGYVPQSIYLSDDTIASNIAFGVDPKNIDKLAVEKASKIACLHEFVRDELSNQYETIVGENGVKLSGGQRQRIGIARALYHKPKVLVLDEATNALDEKTEKLLMKAIYDLSKEITIIIITHRLSTLKNCDVIYKINKGKVTIENE
jgi:ABC-type bacteriocin/lantibiotic exporter with double-glycine peptidase domain